MNEYISKDKIIQDIEEEIGISNMALDEDVWFNRGLKTALSYIKKTPTADVQPVKHGRWIKQEGFWNKNTVKCSLCGNYLDMNGVNGGRSDANYCPNCGARMDLE